LLEGEKVYDSLLKVPAVTAKRRRRATEAQSGDFMDPAFGPAGSANLRAKQFNVRKRQIKVSAIQRLM
jgi:hypothetical protein